MSVHQLSLPHLGQGRELAPRGRRLPSFMGAKTPAPIIHSERWHRDVLIALSLDARIATIEAVDDAARPRGVLFTVGVTGRPDGALIVRIVADEDSRRLSEPMPGVLVLARETLLRSPALEARRAVWAARDAAVQASDRYRVVAALASAPDGLPLREVIRLVEGRAREVVDAVCALACEDVIAIDLTNGLTPEAQVRRTAREP